MPLVVLVVAFLLNNLPIGHPVQPPPDNPIHQPIVAR